MSQLTTRWGKNLNPDHVHYEYPRPGMVRESYYCLNGVWDYAISTKKMVDQYDGTIVVPFSPESHLSGVERMVHPEEYLHYRRFFQIPDNFIKERVLLHFDAVDQECEVIVNGKIVGTHKGGYLPFSFDVTDVIEIGDNEVNVIVKDATEKAPYARGKQKLVKKGHMASIFYTPSSGIWKSVWLESVPERYITSLKLTPLFDEKQLEIKAVTSDGDGIFGPEEYHGSLERNPYPNMLHVQIYYQGVCIANGKIDKNSDSPRMTLPEIHPWTPQHPDLYQIRIQYGRDVVLSYFGMRKLHKQKDASGVWRFYLNNKPFFFQGVLDQGYWPESLMTPPSDEALKYDIQQLKKMGFNTIRKHVKIESDRFYYHCDKMGMLVWQDMPNGGGDYPMGFVTYLPNAFPRFQRMVKDRHYTLFSRKDAGGREQFRSDLAGMVTALYNHPCIALWCPFNEGWGQFDAGKATELIRSIDTTRFINEACGWFDQGGGDVYSIHNYLRQLQLKPNAKRILALTEYGGYAYPIANHTFGDKEFGYKDYKSAEELNKAYEELYETDIFPNLGHGLSAAIYTQTSDIENEINGFMTYDREVDKIDPLLVKRLNEKLYRIFDAIVENEG